MATTIKPRMGKSGSTGSTPAPRTPNKIMSDYAKVNQPKYKGPVAGTLSNGQKVSSYIAPNGREVRSTDAEQKARANRSRLNALKKKAGMK